MAEHVRDAYRSNGATKEVGYLWSCPNTPDDPWFLGMYLIPTTPLGGADDGARFYSGFSLNLLPILSILQNLQRLEWQNPMQYNSGLVGPQVRLQGLFAGKRVELQLLALPPTDTMVSVIDEATGEWRPAMT
jgi:hypothetical protein